MTPPEIIASLEAAGVRVWPTEAGKLGFRPTPAPELLALLKANRDAVLDYLLDPDAQGRAMPTEDAIGAACARREALWRPMVVNIGRPGLGPGFIAEQHRLAGLGLVILGNHVETGMPVPVEVLCLSPESGEEECSMDPAPADESFATFLEGEPPVSQWAKTRVA